VREDFLNDITWRRIASMRYWRTLQALQLQLTLVEARPIGVKPNYLVKRIVSRLFPEKLLRD